MHSLFCILTGELADMPTCWLFSWTACTQSSKGLISSWSDQFVDVTVNIKQLSYTPLL